MSHKAMCASRGHWALCNRCFNWIPLRHARAKRYTIQWRFILHRPELVEGLHVINARLTGRAGLSLIEQTNGNDLVYSWFDYLKKQNHRIAGYFIMPIHVHALIDFARSTKKINTVIGDGKRFMAYESKLTRFTYFPVSPGEVCSAIFNIAVCIILKS